MKRLRPCTLTPPATLACVYDAISMGAETAGAWAQILPVFFLGWIVAGAADPQRAWKRKPWKKRSVKQRRAFWLYFVLLCIGASLFAFLEMTYLIVFDRGGANGVGAFFLWMLGFGTNISTTGNIIRRALPW